jgi:hypothetical protein
MASNFRMKGEEESDIVWREDREEKWMKPSRDSTLLSYHLFYLSFCSLINIYFPVHLSFSISKINIEEEMVGENPFKQRKDK